MTTDDRISKFEAEVAAMRELLYDLARERHTTQEHHQRFPNGIGRGECHDAICRQAYSMTRKDDER